MRQGRALVLFSGGQDSTTCLAWALRRYQHVETVGFDYGQRHQVEMECRNVVRQRFLDSTVWQDGLGPDHKVNLGVLGQLSDTALTSSAEIRYREGGLPNTFVPGRNLLFLTFAATIGYRRDIDVLVGGMCETDFSGYPDCRDETLKALGRAISLGMDRPFEVETPLMWIDKAATWALAFELGGSWLVDLIREDTHTCYLGVREQLHEWGRGCGSCPACELRARGYRIWKKNVEPKNEIARPA